MKFCCIIFTLFASMMWMGCYDKDNYKSIKGVHDGFAPVYQDSPARRLDAIESLPPQPIVKSGKIYLFRHFLFINEQDKGIHIFDNGNPATPIPVCFLKIPGNYDVSCKDSTMFAESKFGLIKINISALPVIKDVGFADPAIKNDHYSPPLTPLRYSSRYGNSKVFFECIDPSRGYIKEWKAVQITDPKCYQSYGYNQ